MDLDREDAPAVPHGSAHLFLLDCRPTLSSATMTHWSSTDRKYDTRWVLTRYYREDSAETKRYTCAVLCSTRGTCVLGQAGATKVSPRDWFCCIFFTVRLHIIGMHWPTWHGRRCGGGRHGTRKPVRWKSFAQFCSIRSIAKSRFRKTNRKWLFSCFERNKHDFTSKFCTCFCDDKLVCTYCDFISHTQTYITNCWIGWWVAYTKWFFALFFSLKIYILFWM